jgi:hypothetical protein
MAKIKTDEQIKNEYLPKIKTFTDNLTPEKAERVYNFLKPYHYDTNGLAIEQAAAEAMKNKSEPGCLAYRAIQIIIGKLEDIQPYLLEGFWNRLSYIEKILEKGLPIKDDLIVKINNELSELTRDMTARKEEPIANLLAEDSAKTAIRNALHNTPLTDYQIQALFIADNVLDDIFYFYQDSGAKGDIYSVVSDFVSNAEKEYLIDRVYDRIKIEYDAYVDEVMKMPPEKIIDEAYKLTISYEFLCAFDGEPRLTAEQLKAIMTFDDPLWSLYHEWQRRDWTMQDDIRDVIRDTADEQAAENANSEYELDPNPFGFDDEEAEDGQEP